MTKRIVATIVGFAMVVVMAPGVIVGQTENQTVEQLQAQIAALQQQLAQLQAQLAALQGAPATTTAVTCTFTRNLYPGITGDDVKCLQQYLNSAGFKLADTGPGSPGNETTFYGPLTKAAVKKWQDANGIAYGAWGGYFGPLSRAKYTELTAKEEKKEEEKKEEEKKEEEVVPSEGILTADPNPVPASGVIAYEGDTNVAVLGILLKAKLSDITVQRVTLNFGTAKVYDYLNYLSLYDGENAVVGTDLNSTTVYKSGANYYLQLAGFSLKVPKDGSKVLTVKVNVNPAISRALNLPQNITVQVEENGVRGVDTAGVIQYAPTQQFSRTFTVRETLASQATLTVSRNPASPLPRNVGTGALGLANNVEVLKFDVKAEYDSVKITDINNVSVATGGSGGATATTAYLYDGETVVGSAAVSNGEADFTDIVVNVPKDTTKTLTIKVDYSSASTTFTTSTVTVSSGANIVAENSQGMTLDSSVITGQAISYPVYLYTIAPDLALTSATITKTSASQTASSSADAKIVFTAKAQGGDVKIPETGAVSAAYTTTTAATTTNTGVAVTYTVTGAILSSGVYTIAKDTTATITVDVHVDANTLPISYQNAFGYVTLTNLAWNSGQNTNWFADIFKTSTVYLP